jgi:predicted PhzF superfamily epimerase YddE/YHI9
MMLLPFSGHAVLALAVPKMRRERTDRQDEERTKCRCLADDVPIFAVFAAAQPVTCALVFVRRQ